MPSHNTHRRASASTPTRTIPKTSLSGNAHTSAVPTSPTVIPIPVETTDYPQARVPFKSPAYRSVIAKDRKEIKGLFPEQDFCKILAFERA